MNLSGGKTGSESQFVDHNLFQILSSQALPSSNRSIEG
jgi:hypothetical protein